MRHTKAESEDDGEDAEGVIGGEEGGQDAGSSSQHQGDVV